MGNQLSGAIIRFQALNGGKLTGEKVEWSDLKSGNYTVALRNQLQEAVKNVNCQVAFYDRSGTVLKTDHVRYEGVISAGITMRVSSKVDSSIRALASTGTTSGVRFEVRVLDFDIAR